MLLRNQIHILEITREAGCYLNIYSVYKSCSRNLSLQNNKNYHFLTTSELSRHTPSIRRHRLLPSWKRDSLRPVATSHSSKQNQGNSFLLLYCRSRRQNSNGGIALKCRIIKTGYQIQVNYYLFLYWIWYPVLI